MVQVTLVCLASDTLSGVKVSSVCFHPIDPLDKEVLPVFQRHTSVQLIGCSWETEH